MTTIINKFDATWKYVTTVTSAINVRVIVAWNLAVLDIIVKKITYQLVHCVLHSKDGMLKCEVFVIYAANEKEHRARLWNELLGIQSTMALPWLVMGDYNVVLNEDKKEVPVGKTKVVTTELAEFLDQCQLEDL